MWHAMIIAAASFIISWPPVPSAEMADGMRVYRATAAGDWAMIADIPAPDTMYTDTAAVMNRRYYYMIRSYRADSLSAPSRIVVGTAFGNGFDPLVEWFWTGENNAVLYSVYLPDTPWDIEYNDAGWYDALSITADVDVAAPFGVVNLSDYSFFGESFTDSTDASDILNIYGKRSRYFPVFFKRTEVAP